MRNPLSRRDVKGVAYDKYQELAAPIMDDVLKDGLRSFREMYNRNGAKC